ncbi:MAG: nickel-dependent lactate racemase [Intestinimonas sp.]|jgi:nickel-dependent lactate racemase|nr:nickel-dependent lactate racemase [Intestinimonas sp.]
MQIRIPYGTDGLVLDHEMPSVEILESSIGNLKATGSEDDIVKSAMAAPIDSPRLCELAKGKKTATIIISDHTRPVPSKHIIPFMLAELREGNPNIDITLLVATGFHRLTTKDELVSKLGEKIVAEEKIVIHDSRDPKTNVDVGVLPSGARCVIDKVAVDADLLVSEGFIEPHFFAGFSGGRKSVLPGICSEVTVLGNHCSKFIASPYARTGVLEGNPLHLDMLEAARLAKLQFIVNVVIDEQKHVAAAYAGNYKKAHEAGCAFLKGYCKVKPKQRGDIVISSNGGAPLDQNMYQCVKGMTAGEAAAKEDGIIIMCARCNDGTGGDGFYHALKDCSSPAALQEEILKVPMDQTKPDQWEYQILCRMLAKHRVIYVTDPSMKTTVEEMKMEYCPDVNEALDRAYAAKGKDAHVVAIPNGISVIVEE